ncbi:hypothetical protein SteCoe_12005 [Stentor coeruleus]|uniref:Uncharacterized protein n=1 Tax=Stentor coeruleus TaxID=5963 RepID=A0A1R2CC18_9CILI|nr:hypothetical protein SteCoe_12005 [Stentor coeruleus]
MKKGLSTIASNSHLIEVPSIKANLHTFSHIRNPVRKTTSISSTRPASLYLDDGFLDTPVAYKHESEVKSCKQSLILEELTSLETQIKELNSQIAHNIEILKKKEERGKELKGIIKKIKHKALPIDLSFEDKSKNWSCTNSCSLF